MNEKPARSRWGSRLGFILVAAGSAVGLGNIWKFPYITGMNGGGAFVLVYLICIAVIALPLLIAEVMVGRASQRSPIGAFRHLLQKNTPFQLVGWSMTVFVFVILSYYSVVGGWTIDYLLKSITGSFIDQDPDSINSLFGALYVHPWKNLLWHAVFMLFVVAIILGGVRKGIERYGQIMMSVLFCLILVLVVRALLSPGALEGIQFIFRPDFGKLTPAAALEALGHSFFTLSLGVGTMLIYGSYLGDTANVPGMSVWVALLDTLIAILACLMIFPIVFSYGFEPAAGPGLVFKTLPVIFSKMVFGQFFAIIFFFLLFVAALTSAISMLEVVVGSCIDNLGWTRKKATWVMWAACFSFGILSALSGGKLSHIKFVGGRNLFDSFDYLASNWAMPLNGLAVAVFVGWFLDRAFRRHQFEKGRGASKSFPIWQFVLRYIVPLAMAFVFLRFAGILKW